MILDILLLLFFILSIYIGYNKGFIMTLAGFVGKILSTLVAYFYSKPFNDFLCKFTGLDEAVLEKVKANISKLGGHAADGSVAGSDISALEKLILPDSIKERMISYLTESASQIGKSVSLSLSNFVMQLISFFLLFLLAGLVLTIALKVLNLFSKLPVLNSFNKIGGALFSFFSAYLLLTIVFLLITSFVSMNVDSIFQAMMEKSRLAKLFVSYNPILLGLAGMSI